MVFEFIIDLFTLFRKITKHVSAGKIPSIRVYLIFLE